MDTRAIKKVKCTLHPVPSRLGLAAQPHSYQISLQKSPYFVACQHFSLSAKTEMLTG
jgi:hypothetical protein